MQHLLSEVLHLLVLYSLQLFLYVATLFTNFLLNCRCLWLPVDSQYFLLSSRHSILPDETLTCSTSWSTADNFRSALESLCLMFYQLLLLRTDELLHLLIHLYMLHLLYAVEFLKAGLLPL